MEVKVRQSGSKADFTKPRFIDQLVCKTWHRFCGRWRLVWVVWFPIYICDNCGMNFLTDRSFFCRDVEAPELPDKDMVKKGVMATEKQKTFRKDLVTVGKIK